MGPGEQARTVDLDRAYHLGKRIAQEQWVLLTGGRGAGVMEAVSRGAKQMGGLTIGILPDSHTKAASVYVDVPICTGMGYGRNNINVLSSTIVVACGMGLGTASEVALALKNQTPVILLGVDTTSQMFFRQFCTAGLYMTREVEETIELIRRFLSKAIG
ncbi:MAG: TIGR00725 family protein [Prochlorotrichaceae cyanobacterium]